MRPLVRRPTVSPGAAFASLRERVPRGSTSMYLLLAFFALLSAVLQFWLALNGDTDGAITGVLIVGVAVIVVAAAVLSALGRDRAAALAASGALIVVALVVTVVHKDPALAVTLPVIGFVLALPYVRGRSLVVFALVILAAIAIVGRASAVARAGPVGGMQIDVMVGGVVTALVLMLFTWRLVRSREELAERMTRFVEGIPVGIFKTDAEGRLVQVNGALSRLLGYGDRSRLVGMVATDLLVDPAPAGGLLAETRDEGGAHIGELPLRRADGSSVWVRYHVRGQLDQNGRIVAYEGALEDVTADRTAREATARLAAWKQDRADILDKLRRLSPGRTLEETADSICVEIASGDEIAYAAILELHNGRGASIVADRAGRRRLAAGTAVAQRFGEELRRRALDGPWVEDVQGRRSEPGYRRFASVGLRQLALVPLESGNQLVGLLLAGSVGDGRELHERLHTLGEFATHAAALLSPALTERMQREDMRDRIRDTIEQGAFWPVFQPIIDLETGTVLGYEALTRFRDGTPPDRMFADASSCGMSVELETATIAAALDASSPLPANRFIDLNVSPEMILAEEPLRTRLRAQGFNIVLEVTEHVAIEDYGEMRAAIASLGNNVQLAVDDAGAGFASLRHITELRPHFVKLDRGLIAGIDRDLIRQALIAGMVHFADSVGSQIIAEGVETEEERWTLLGLGVRSAQGYLFGRPASADLVQK